jgi:hypothetical protein
MTRATNMDIVTTRLWRNVWVGIAALVCTLVVFLVGAQDQARADTLLGQSGYPGPSRLYEPSASCRYDRTTNTVTVAAYGVHAWARSGYNNGQWVGYRYRVFEYSQATNWAWSQIGASQFKNAVAYPNSYAPLQNFATTFKRPYGSTVYSHQYHKVLVDIYWYNASGNLSGSVTRQVDQYNQGGVIRSGECKAQ